MFGVETVVRLSGLGDPPGGLPADGGRGFRRQPWGSAEPPGSVPNHGTRPGQGDAGASPSQVLTGGQGGLRVGETRRTPPQATASSAKIPQGWVCVQSNWSCIRQCDTLSADEAVVVGELDDGAHLVLVTRAAACRGRCSGCTSPTSLRSCRRRPRRAEDRRARRRAYGPREASPRRRAGPSRGASGSETFFLCDSPNLAGTYTIRGVGETCNGRAASRILRHALRVSLPAVSSPRRILAQGRLDHDERTDEPSSELVTRAEGSR